MSRRRKKLRLRSEIKIFLFIVVVLIVLAIYGIDKYKEYQYHQTYEYKLLEHNYSKEEVSLILDKLDDEYINKLLESVYSDNIYKFLNEKYFISKNLDRYLDYYKRNNKLDRSKVVALVNTNRDRDLYEGIVKTDTSKDILMLINKYYALSEDYVPENIVKVSNTYAYQGNSVRQDVLDAFIEMANASKEEDIVLVINSSYRSYKDQDEIWNYRKNNYGIEKADQYAARAGHSEHQSGLAIDIAQFNSKEQDFEKTPAFTWLENNAYKYGFILRFKKDAEDITGYKYESWHYRYVGKEVATKVHEENITYDEYYAYYIDNK